tara:strand:+ start:958 stop:3348 length:2391 start_codon:yes stop_codon:yes gene_type:complete
MNAGIAAYVILSQNTDVTDIVGVNIFPEVAEQETATPFIVYQLQSVAPEDTHDGPSKLDEVRFEFLCYADSYALAADLGDKVRGALDRVSGTYNGVNVESVQFNDVDIDTIDAPRRFAQVLTFTFRIKRDNFTIAQGTPVTGAKLSDLSDVDVAGVTDGQFIKYVAAQQEWQAADSAGGVTSLAALTDVNLTGLGSKDVINYNSTTGKWEPVDFLNVLYTNLKTGVSTTINDGSNTNSALELGATTAKLKTGISEILITETSPGDIDFIVATDGSGTTAYNALNIDGSTSANEAILNIPVGTQLHIKSPTHYAYLRYTGGANALLSLPTSSGTIARTADIALDSAVAANTAKISYTDASAVAANTAKTGITSGQALAITANTAKVSYTDASAVAANTAKVGITTQQASDISTNNAKVGVIAGGTTGQALVKSSGTDYATQWANVSDTNLANTNLTLNADRTLDTDGNTLTFDPNGGSVRLLESGAATPYINCEQGNLQLNGLSFPGSDGTSGQVLQTNGLGSLSFTNVSSGTTFDYARAIMSADVLQGGANQQDFDSATPQKVKFDTSADTEGTGITIDTTNNRITVGHTSYYQLTANVSFYSNGTRTTPATIFKKNGSTDLLGEGYGYIRATSGQNHNNNLISCIVELQANDYVEVFVGDTATVSASCFATQAFFEVSSTGGGEGPAGAQGPSGTTYDVVTLTGSTTLSNVHTTKYLVVDSASNCNITVPASASYDANAEFVIEQRGAGAVTVVAASGVTVNSSETLVSGGQYAVMGLKRTASNVYTLTGERQTS